MLLPTLQSCQHERFVVTASKGGLQLGITAEPHSSATSHQATGMMKIHDVVTAFMQDDTNRSYFYSERGRTPAGRLQFLVLEHF